MSNSKDKEQLNKVADNQPGKWRRIPKLSFSSKDLSRRMKKVEGATVRHARRFVFKRMNSIREVRQHIILWILTIGIIIGASGLQLMWYQQSYRATANANDGTYAEAVLGPVKTLNPIFASTSAEESASYLLFSRLLTYDKTGHLNYDLASNMTISSDQKTYTLSLRPDAKWQDGVYVRAKDVIYTVDLLKNPATRATITGWNDISAKAVDDMTVQFTLPDVYAAFPHALNFLPILPEHILRDVAPGRLRENNFSTNPIGSGPFTLRFIQDIDGAVDRSVINLGRNPSYYNGTPKLERFQLHVYPTSEGIVRAITTSEVNAATDLSVSDATKMNNSRYSVERKPINAGVYALLNTTVGVMSDKTVRQALQMGTDTSAVRSAVGGNTPEIHLPFITGQVTGDVPSEIVYNKVGAGELLDKAGWKLDGTVRKKDGNLLRLTVVTTKNNDFEKALTNMAQQWRGLGITVTTSIVDPSDASQNVVQNILQPRAYDVLLYQLTIGGDPDVYAYWHSSQASKGFNFSNYSNENSDDALTSARSRIEPDLRNAKYVTFAKQWMADAPAIGLYQATMQYVSSKNVHALPADDLLVSAADRYSDVLYWTVGTRLVEQTP
ncbi:peptide ABC transporter substrate-binding protein [Candidatus Saccharibacteria bacterium]|nr:peptide ABC transporter substrate-binding protein [Candidatus Saccharibacteria bacterium]